MTPTKYVTELADNYGLTTTIEDGSIFLRLREQDVIQLMPLNKGQLGWSWSLWPLADGGMSGRYAEGFVKGDDQDQAMMDAEGMLRVYLRNTPANTVLAVWPMETMLSTRTFRRRSVLEVLG